MGFRPGVIPLVAAIALTLPIAIGCATTRPQPSGDSAPSATPGIPILEPDVAVATAASLAEIQGPLAVTEAVSGTFAALDPSSHNDPGDLAEADRIRALASRAVWRVGFTGPDGTETLLVDAETGELLAAVTQGS